MCKILAINEWHNKKIQKVLLWASEKAGMARVQWVVLPAPWSATAAQCGLFYLYICILCYSKSI